jgi:hypothetical protein
MRRFTNASEKLKIIDDIAFLRCSLCHEWKTLDKFQKRNPPAFMNRDSQCKECKYKLSAEYQKARYEESPEFREKKSEYHRNYYENNKDKIIKDGRLYVLRTKYNLTEEEFNELAKDGCMICGGRERLAVDHDHETNEVRGILCVKCNTALGSFDDSIELLYKAISYLKKNEVENAI